ncbi:MAG: hypothetical protein FWH48_02305 [Oscillospiraceae bacterium]|nr:hypothetical protein [Oscillospiraceae bacterium]
MKPIKKILKILLPPAIIFAFPIFANAGDLAADSPKTGDGGLLAIAVAAVACAITAFVTLKLTKHKNKKIK